MNKITKEYFLNAFKLRGAAKFFDALGAYYDAASLEERHQAMALAHSADPLTDFGHLLGYFLPEDGTTPKNDLIGAIQKNGYRRGLDRM